MSNQKTPQVGDDIKIGNGEVGKVLREERWLVVEVSQKGPFSGYVCKVHETNATTCGSSVEYGVPKWTCADAAAKFRQWAREVPYFAEAQAYKSRADILDAFGTREIPKKLLEEWNFKFEVTDGD